MKDICPNCGAKNCLCMDKVRVIGQEELNVIAVCKNCAMRFELGLFITG